MTPTKSMTFDRLIQEILQHPDTSVEIEHIFVGSTHLFAESQRDIIRSKIAIGVQPGQDIESVRSKKYCAEVLEELRAGRTAKLKKWSYNQYL